MAANSLHPKGDHYIKVSLYEQFNLVWMPYWVKGRAHHQFSGSKISAMRQMSPALTPHLILFSFCSQLADLVSLVRGKLTKLHRMILSALIVIEVHARDVGSKMLEENVKNVNDFEWISQLRYIL